MSLNRIGWCLGVGLFLLLLQWSLAPVLGAETDIWWHLAAGQRLWQHGLELRDPYSFTEAQQHWVRIDWLFQALLYPVYRLAGWNGLILLRSAVLLGAAALVAVPLWGRRPAEIWLLVMLTSSIWCESVSFRPATVSFLLTALWVLLLERARSGQTRALWLLPPVMVVWFNLHVAALAGLLLLGLYAVGQGLEGWRQGRKSDWLWWKVLPLCTLAPFCNPQGWEAVYYPIHFLLVKTIWRDIILEVQAPRWDWAGTWQAWLLLAFSILGALGRARRGELTPLLVTLACGWLMTHTYRHQFQLCSALTPWIALRLPAAAETVCSLLSVVLGLPALVGLLCLRWPLQGLIRRESFNETAALLAAAGPNELRVFTDMNAAGYYLWNFQGRQKVFLDSRGDQVYRRTELIQDYFAILAGGPAALGQLDRYQVQAVAINRIAYDAPALSSELRKSTAWTCLYQGLTGEFYCRRELATVFPKPREPVFLVDYQRGYAFVRQGQPFEARGCWLRSLQDYPQFAYAYQSLAGLSRSQGDRAGARRELARSEFYHPSNASLNEDWRRLGVSWPACARAYFLPFWAL
ncbi:MAG: hypothetical protein KF760_05825 [Candidatus Eremiobacteraeota bacterium]|nr:hypothetical protein [Candidatus Eremiobacteraeota bacterium]MCW5867087.1 hypothetical protein [Candidatus Eremiobacteraeota bacterium]